MNTNILPDDLVDMRAAASLVRVNLATVHRWRLTGRLRCWKRVGRYLVSRAELLGLAQPAGGQEVPVVPPTAQMQADRERRRAEGLKRHRLV